VVWAPVNGGWVGRVREPARVAKGRTPRDLERAVEEAQVRRLVNRCELEPHRSLASRSVTSRRLLARRAEWQLLALIRAARLPAPGTNARVGAYEVDFLWPEHRLVVEVDGFAFHSTRAAFERDRDRALQAVRITWRQLVEEPEAVVPASAAALVRRYAASIRPISSTQPAFASGSLRLPHLGDCTHDGQPLSQGHSPTSRWASSTSVSNAR
jgi:very-short-patch-repair endonuclease